MISITAAKDESRYLWAHVVVTWIVSLILYVAFWRLWNEFARLRQEYFRSADYQRSVNGRTIMLLDLPTSMQSEKGLAEFLKRSGVYHTYCQPTVARKLGNLPGLLEQHQKSVEALEEVLEKFLHNPKKISDRPTIKLRWWGDSVDAINYYTARISELEEKITLSREKAQNYTPSNLAFVTYPTTSLAHYAAWTLKSRREVYVRMAPQVRDIIWGNAELPYPVRATRKWTGLAFYTAFLVLGLSWVTFLSTLANLDKLKSTSPMLENFSVNSPTAFALIASMITPLIMILFFLLLPHFLRLITMYQGLFIKSRIEREVLRKYYAFLFFNNFIFATNSLIAGFINAAKTHDLSAARSTLTNTDYALKNMADSLIDISTFWVNYTTIRGTSVVIELAQAAALIRVILQSSFYLSSTPRNRRKLTRPMEFPFAVLYTTQLFLFTITLMFATIAPIIMPFAIINFSLSLLVYKYQIIYVYKTKIETGGRMWPVVFNRMIFAVIVFQILMLGAINFNFSNLFYISFVSARVDTIQCLMLLPLPLITYVYKRVHMSKHMEKFEYLEEIFSKRQMDADEPVPEITGRRKSVSSGDLEMRYSHRALNAPLEKVLISEVVAKNVEKYYMGPYRVEGMQSPDGLQRALTTKSSWTLAVSPEPIDPEDINTDDELPPEENKL